MNHRSHYYTLIASLPPIPPGLEQVRLPINWPRLEGRLAMLSERDRKIIRRLESFLHWERRPRCRTDREVMSSFEKIQAGIEYPLADEIVNSLMEIRILVAAVRRRQRDLPPPEPAGIWGRHIVRNWQRTNFGLGVRFPWLDELRGDLAAGRIMAAHHLVVSVIWDYLGRLAENHYFDFEAVMLYLVRWDVVSNWVRQDREKGRKRFDQLTTEVMGQYAELFD